MDLPEIGKISPQIFSGIIFPRLGAKSEHVLVGPQHGVDGGIAEIGGKAVSFTTDPVAIISDIVGAPGIGAKIARLRDLLETN